MRQRDLNTAKQTEVIQSHFDRDGYVVISSFFRPEEVAPHAAFVRNNLDPLIGPVEFESDVGYPGAPASRNSPGGGTPRRLLNALQRGNLHDMATDVSVELTLRNLMKTDQLYLSQNHHNCVMTKYPGFSSSTHWHQDIRYWSFKKPELVSMWIPLGVENEENGALRVIPGSHRLEFEKERFDSELFLRMDIERNLDLVSNATTFFLQPGDVLFFHSRLLHAAGKNKTKGIKLSVVYTYYSAENSPIPGTRSAINAPVGLP